MNKNENQVIIKSLNMYGRVPEMWELLEKIERLNNIINDYYNQINTLSSKISLILERLEYEETNTESLKEDIIEIIFNKQITLGSDKE